MSTLGSAFYTVDAARFGAGGFLLQAFPPALFFALPCITFILLPLGSWGNIGAGASACAAILPRLLWQPSQPAEGRAFWLANCMYWNLVYPAFFGSPLLILLCCYLRPLAFAPLVGAWLVYSRLLSRPDLQSGAPWQYFAESDWGIIALRRYLRLRLHVSVALRERDAAKPVIIGIHPHGVASDYRVAMDGLLYDALPGRKVFTLAASVLFALPLVASKALSKGLSLCVIPGGEAEQMRTQTGVEEVYLTKRLGFVKLALTHGAALVPAYAFGTVDLYDVSPSQHKTNSQGFLWTLSKRYGVAMPLYTGALGFVPKRAPNDLVLGTPIEPRPCATPGQPTDAEVQAAHADYVKALQTLFDEHKAALGYGDRQLVVS